MNKIEAIQKCLQEEIERTQKEMEEKGRCKFYNDAAKMQERKDTLIWVWNLIARFRD